MFEGRDAAGEGGVIKPDHRGCQPSGFRVVALSKPTEREASQIHTQRYMQGTRARDGANTRRRYSGHGAQARLVEILPANQDERERAAVFQSREFGFPVWRKPIDETVKIAAVGEVASPRPRVTLRPALPGELSPALPYWQSHRNVFCELLSDPLSGGQHLPQPDDVSSRALRDSRMT
jgi:hypothetical protein